MARDSVSKRPEVRHLNPPGGDWLFKLRGEVLGPVPSVEIIQRMFTGEVDESTEISTGEGDWRSIHSVPDFHPFLFQARAKLRADRARAEALRAEHLRRVRNLVKVAVFAVILVVASFMVSYHIIVSRPWRNQEALRAWAAKHVPLLRASSASLAGLEPRSNRSSDPEEEINIDQILIDDAPSLVAIKPATADQKSRWSDRKKASEPDDEQNTGGKTSMTGPLTNEEITTAVYARSNLNLLYACIRTESKRNPDLPSTIHLGFTINNDGRVGVVRVDNFKLEDGPLYQCFQQKLTKLKFRPYPGERRNVEIPFNIGK